MRIYPHEAILNGRLNNTKHKNAHKEQPLLREIKVNYLKWRVKRESIPPTDNNYLPAMVDFTNEYLNSISDKKYELIRNNGQGKIYPSILEEAMVVFFEHLVSDHLECGNMNIPIGLSFKPVYLVKKEDNYFNNNLFMETFNADFVIGFPTFNKDKVKILYPYVVIENKRYMDKTMKMIANGVATKLKILSPNCMFVVVCEVLSGCFDKDNDPEKDTIDQIYGLKEGNARNDDSLRLDVVTKLYEDIKNHLIHVHTKVTREERMRRGFMKDHKNG
jgi:hypothetical protein